MQNSAESEYLFRHALMRDVAYNLHMPSERAGLHAMAAHAWQAMAQAASTEHADALATEVVFHGALASEAEPELAAAASGIEYQWLPVAAQYHKRQFDHAANRVCWKRRADHPLASGADRASALVRLAEACIRAADKAAALDASRQAADAARRHAPGLVPEALALHGSALLLIGDYPAARTALDEAARTAPHGSATHVMASRLIGQLLVSTTDPHWREATQRAIELAREAGLADELAQARNVMAVALINFGDLREAEACAREVVEAAASEGNQWMEAVGLLNYSLAAWQLHGVAHARPLLDRCISLARQVGHTRLLIAATFQSAQFARAQGEYGRAYETLQALIGQARESGSIREQQAIPDLLVPLCNTLGRAEESLAAARHAYALSNRRDYRAHEAEAAMLLGRLDLAVERANDLLAQRVDPAEAPRDYDQSRAICTVLLARVCWLRDDQKTAREKFTEAQAILDKDADPVFVRLVAWQARTFRESCLHEEAREVVTASRTRMLRPDPWFLLEGVHATSGSQDEASWRSELHECIARMRDHEGPELRAALRLI